MRMFILLMCFHRLKTSNRETLHYQIDEHYSELGHSIVANSLAKQIELLGWDPIKSHNNLHKPSTGNTKSPFIQWVYLHFITTLRVL